MRVVSFRSESDCALVSNQGHPTHSSVTQEGELMSNSNDPKAQLLIRVFNGARTQVDSDVDLLITLRDGNQSQRFRDYRRGPEVRFELPFSNNFVDAYSVIVSAKHWKQAGFYPVRISPHEERRIDLMLLPDQISFEFSYPDLPSLSSYSTRLAAFLGAGATDAAAAQARYAELIGQRTKSAAALFNITTALSEIHLPELTALDYFVQLMWDDSLQQDRFFARARESLIEQVRIAAHQGKFDQEHGAEVFHPGATLSYKENRLGEANVQLTFHENEKREIEGTQCVKVEPDIDYYKDPLAHALLEVVPNHITGGLSDPEQVYVLRWIAGQQAGLPQFNPPYTIVQRCS